MNVKTMWLIYSKADAIVDLLDQIVPGPANPAIQNNGNVHNSIEENARAIKSLIWPELNRALDQ